MKTIFLLNNLRIGRLVVLCVVTTSLLQISSTVTAQTSLAKDYFVYVLSEAADKISLIRFGPGGARVEREIVTGDMPVDLDGPHGISISPDKQFYYVSLAHGRPFGSVWKYSVKDDRVVGRSTLGLFPATMDISKDGTLLFVVNFNLHGDMTPSTVSVVATEPMLEVARIQTCAMPHGSRLNSLGTRHYSACMMDDLLVEIDTRTLKVSRHFRLTKDREMGSSGLPNVKAASADAGKHDMSGHGMEPPKPGDLSCSPTWAQPAIDGSSIFVACNKSSEVVEIDAETWKMKRRIASRPGVYNLAVTRDGKRLITTNKRDQSVSVIELPSGRELARILTKRTVLHGVVVSPDDRFAFVSVEGVGAQPGTVEVIDLTRLTIAASVDVAQGAAGIDFLLSRP